MADIKSVLLLGSLHESSFVTREWETITLPIFFFSIFPEICDWPTKERLEHVFIES